MQHILPGPSKPSRLIGIYKFRRYYNATDSYECWSPTKQIWKIAIPKERLCEVLHNGDLLVLTKDGIMCYQATTGKYTCLLKLPTTELSQAELWNVRGRIYIGERDEEPWLCYLKHNHFIAIPLPECYGTLHICSDAIWFEAQLGSLSRLSGKKWEWLYQRRLSDKVISCTSTKLLLRREDLRRGPTMGLIDLETGEERVLRERLFNRKTGLGLTSSGALINPFTDQIITTDLPLKEPMVNKWHYADGTWYRAGKRQTIVVIGRDFSNLPKIMSRKVLRTLCLANRRSRYFPREILVLILANCL